MIRTFAAGALFFGSTLFGLSLGDISEKPAGHVKNFLIWEYLQQEVSPVQADRAFEQIENVNTKLYLTYAKRSDNPDVVESARCMRLKTAELLPTRDDACLMLGLSPYKVSQLSRAERHTLAERLKDSPYAPWLRFMAETTVGSDPATFEPGVFMEVARRGGRAYRRAFLDRDYPPLFLRKLAKHWGFPSLVKLVVTDPEMKRFQRSLLALEEAEVKAQTRFFLALNQLRHGYKKAALQLLERAYDTFYYRMDKDKALFWQYQITKAPELLTRLAESDDINIYTLYADELLERHVDNYFITLESGYQKPRLDITDPFAWERILDEIRATPKDKLFDLANTYRSEMLEPVQAFILERAYRYKMHNFIQPYREMMSGMENDKKSLMLSLMRQESRFIPSALSRSFALGLMQMMPFLVRAMDKEEKRKTVSLHKMFDPQTNIDYASRHIDYLLKHLYHPLFIAYAYNGGIGFTKRMLLGGAFAKGPYEPFWSMEMMANAESREYGKKVLANYVVYKNIFGERVSIGRLFDNLMHPSRTDRFRASR
jgi:soluble lytic murein transglycosylase